MRKLIITSVFVILSIMTCFAAPPKLACEILFNDPGLRNDNTEVHISTHHDNYYRSFKVKGDANLVKLIEEKVKIDTKRAYNVLETFTGKNGYSTILNINNNDMVINIGYTRESDTDANIFVQGDVAAFK